MLQTSEGTDKRRTHTHTTRENDYFGQKSNPPTSSGTEVARRRLCCPLRRLRTGAADHAHSRFTFLWLTLVVIIYLGNFRFTARTCTSSPTGGTWQIFKNKFECNNDIESWRLLYKRRPVRALSSDWFCFSFEFHLNVDRIHFLFFVHEPRMASTWLIALTLFFFYKMEL